MRKFHPKNLLSWVTVLAAIIAAVGLLSLFGWDEYRNWLAQKARSEVALQQASDGLARQFEATVQLARMALGDIVLEARKEADSPMRGFNVRKMMLRQLASAPQMEMVSAFDEKGKLIAISANAPPSDVDFSKQDYFVRHKNTRDPLPYVALPQKSRLDGKWVLTLSQRLDDAKGNFAGVVVTSFTMRYFDEFFHTYGLNADAAFVIARADGIVLAQAPYDAERIGQNLTADKRFPSTFEGANNGIIFYTSPADKQMRVGAFKQSAETGIIVLTTSTVSSIFAQWAHDEALRWIALAAVVALSMLAIYSWVIQSRRRLQSEQRVAAREAEFRLLAEASIDLIQRLDLDGKRLYVSPAAQNLFGIDPSELVGHNFIDGLDEANSLLVLGALGRLRKGSELEKIVVTRRLPDGTTAWVETTFRQVTDGTGTSVVAVSRDITAQKLQHSELEELARTDGLTSLSNRRAFDEAFRQLVEESKWTKKPLSLLMIDVDCFKKFNDHYGHAAGDDCLKAVAGAVRATLRERTDFAFRYGGEELSVLLTSTDLKRALACAERVRAAIEKLALPHALHLPGQVVTVSIGVAVLLDSEGTVELLKRADAALYEAKDNGRNRVAGGVYRLSKRTASHSS